MLYPSAPEFLSGIMPCWRKLALAGALQTRPTPFLDGGERGVTSERVRAQVRLGSEVRLGSDFNYKSFGCFTLRRWPSTRTGAPHRLHHERLGQGLCVDRLASSQRRRCRRRGQIAQIYRPLKHRLNRSRFGHHRRVRARRAGPWCMDSCWMVRWWLVEWR